ncbi:MAG: zinc-binding dehydrogenase [Chloroflexi bacterium]|nr:zinc-binding dehydrogenase [Chloroflexota bacterium]MBV9543125.1 zinc-binding dehydrogenase [Chloroflexota bacterium]
MDGRIAILTQARGPWELRTYPLPEPEPGAILVRISYANICGSDLHWWRGENVIPRHGRAQGHEMTGRVVALGRGVTSDSTGQPLSEGDRIIYNYFWPCGRCVACLRGMPECCANKGRPGNGNPEEFPHFVAAFSEYYYLLPGHVCVKVPDELSDAVVAPINCALAQVMQALDSGGFHQGDTLVVQGAGGLGLNMIAAARDMGADRVIAVDAIPGRLKLACDFGADAVVDVRQCPSPADRIAAVRELTNGYGATHVADVAGVRGVVAEGIQMLGSGGTYLEVGSIVPGFEFPLDPLEACRRGLRFIAFMQYDPRLLPRALNFVMRSRARVPWDRIISHTFPLDGIQEAFEQAEWVGREPDQAAITRAALTP